jgi:lysophospholipid acyltransferase (LPLAT)-like uncharacterized protein
MSDLPHGPDLNRWLDALFVGTNATLFALHRIVTPTARVHFREPFLPADAKHDGKPLIYMTWHRLNYACMPVFLSLPPEARPTLIMHDGVASRAFSHRSTVWMGFESFVFRRNSNASPREQIAAYIRSTGRPILNLPDSGGPYGVVKPGILEVARACDARLVPFQVTAKPALSVGKKLQHVIPLPYCRIDVRRGVPLSGHSSVDDCQRALDALA